MQGNSLQTEMAKNGKNFEISEYFNDKTVKDFICGRNMLAVIAAP
jgi:hypothetical protein